jgi:hippurate hydrolase
MAGADFFDIRIKGYGSHAAKPHQSRDPIIAAAALVQALQAIVSRNTDPMESAVLSITQLHAGTAYNVIPGEAVLTGTVRTFSAEVAEMIRQRMRAVVAGIATASGVEIDIDLRTLFSVLENHPAETAAFTEACRDIVGEENVLTDPRPMMGSEDFADMLHAVPGCYCWVGHAGDVPLHNPGFILDDGILPIGASILARIAERRLAA